MEKSCQVIEILFWIGIGIVFYTYLGYGIVLYLMVKVKELFVKPRLPRLPETLPEATLLIGRLQRGGDRGEQDGELQTTGLSGG